MTTSNTDIARDFLAEAGRQLEECHQKVRHCLAQLTVEQAWWRVDPALNSIANLVLHLSGNIGQRIGSLIGEDSDDRDRDREFAERREIPVSELLTRFEVTVRRAERVLADLAPERLAETRRYRMLRGEVEATLLVVIMQTLNHLAGHTQEIIALTRLQLRGRYRFLQTPQASSP
jgi:hypothetical protein